jgi:hypothetical protein
MEMAFRVLLSLTQDDASWCQAFLEDELTLPFIMRIIMKSHAQRCSALSNRRVAEVAPQVEDDNDAQILDRLCLALGLLTNLVQISDMAKDLTRNIRKSGLLGCHPCNLDFVLTGLNTACIGKRSCIKACQCSQRISAIDCLVQVYMQQTKGSDIDPGANFLRGHIAVLLGLLMRDNKTNQKVLLAALPGSSNRKKIASLAEQAREFVTFYAELAVRLASAMSAKDRDSEENGGSAPRSDDYEVERMVGDGNGNVAREIVSFLETLSTQQA